MEVINLVDNNILRNNFNDKETIENIGKEWKNN